ncbi:MAG: rubrerythrin family protein [Anaerolineaceae bacterium]|nr:rubrerythrin family protein [Anaerolineaceae bacterium]
MAKQDPIIAAYLDEKASTYLYQALSEVEKDPRLAEVYARIAKTEIHHAEKWKAKAAEKGMILPEFKPDWRTRTLAHLARRFGPSMVLPAVQNMERTGVVDYSNMDGATVMKGEEQSHSRLINQIMKTSKGGLSGAAVAQLEGRHRSTGGNSLRAAVLGANDGMVSNLSLVMGVAGATMGGKEVLVAGVAGLLAGAISMALGEWLSVQSSRELYHYQITTEKEEIEQSPEEEIQELALIYQTRGISEEEAQRMANQLLANKDAALETLAREELGIDPEELGGSAWEAAITSFLLFTVGAIIPLFPFFFLTGMTAVFVSIAVSAVGLFLLGAVITLFTGRSIWFSGMRMVLFGLLAAAITFGIGRLIGVSIGG